LRKITSRAKKVYILYEGIGIDKISQITYSASAISSLKDIQIQNIINDFPKKLTDMNCQAQSTISSEIKAIGVTNCHAHMSDPSSSNDISDTKVNLSPVSIDLKIKASEEAKKVLLETGINVLPSDTKTNIIKPPVSPLFIFDYFDFNSSVSYPICNKDHKKENIRYNVEGEWGSGDYVNTKTYRLKCWEANQNSIQIVTVKA